jgi:hypothetical protein
MTTTRNTFKLSDFPKGFEPLAVVIGDRREGRPRTIGDLLAYSVSSIDLMFLAELQLPSGTLIVSDKVFVIEDESTLRDRFRGFNLLTIGSPAVNLFSRMINDQSVFRFEISDEAKVQLEHQRRIVLPHKFDRSALEFYIAIVTGQVTSVDALPDFSDPTDTEVETFNSIREQVLQSGLTNYKALLHEFSGSCILDPMKDGAFDFAKPIRHGFRKASDKDYGLVSLASHPYADDKCVIYVAGTHGPATAFAVHLLGTSKDWAALPYGGVFEVIIPQFIGFAHRLQRSGRNWQTKSYAVDPGLDLSRIPRPKQPADLRVFISLPMSGATARPELPILALKKISSRDVGQSIEWIDPYNIPKGSIWDFRAGIQAYFPTMDFVIHDITGLSPGVMFEVGYSRGLDKKRLLLWDTSYKAFDAQQLPPILANGVQIDSVDFNDALSLCAIVSQGIKATQTGPTRPSAPVNPATPISVLVLASPTCRATLEPTLLSQLRARNRGPIVCETPLSLSELCGRIEASDHVIVASHSQYCEGNLALGLGSALKKRVLEIYEDGAPSCVMFDGLKQPWNVGNVEISIQNGLNRLFGHAAVGTL